MALSDTVLSVRFFTFGMLWSEPETYQTYTQCRSCSAVLLIRIQWDPDILSDHVLDQDQAPFRMLKGTVSFAVRWIRIRIISAFDGRLDPDPDPGGQ
jgi:hypothetical protein